MHPAADLDPSHVTADPPAIPDRPALDAAYERVRGVAHRTPVLTSTFFDQRLGAELFFKCESFQKMGAFKFRGAWNAVAQLDDDELARGVVTHSSGNHAQALALAARLRGARATIVMPHTAPAVKLAAVRGYGAEVVLCEPTVFARESSVDEIVARTGAVLIHPFNDPRIIAGQSTGARELIEEVPDLDLIVAPVGGGGLLSGTVLAARHLAPRAEVWGAEPSAADDAWRSLQSGRIEPAVSPPQTIADGLLTCLGELTFAVIREGAAGIVTVDDAAIITTLRQIWERMKIVVEPSAAVPLAALLDGRSEAPEVAGRRVGILVSGGNVDLEKLPWLGER